MSIAVSRIDRIPVLPLDAAGWREVGEYIASIALGFTAGVLGRRCLVGVEGPVPEKSFATKLAEWLVRSKIAGTTGDASHAISSLEAIVTSTLALGAALASILAGVGRLLH
jgi:hypothetical protein